MVQSRKKKYGNFHRFEEGDRRGRQVISNIEKIFRSFAFLSTVRSASQGLAKVI